MVKMSSKEYLMRWSANGYERELLFVLLAWRCIVEDDDSETGSLVLHWNLTFQMIVVSSIFKFCLILWMALGSADLHIQALITPDDINYSSLVVSTVKNSNAAAYCVNNFIYLFCIR